MRTKVGDVISQTLQRQLTWNFWIEIIVKVVIAGQEQGQGGGDCAGTVAILQVRGTWIHVR